MEESELKMNLLQMALGDENAFEKVYGSFDSVKNKVLSFTYEQYMRLGMKLSGAQKELGVTEYTKFERLLKPYASAKIEYGNGTGNIDFDKMPAAERAKLKQVMADLQVYFDLLNHQKPMREILSTSDYDRYIDALMTLETVWSAVGQTHFDNIGQVPASYRDRYAKARQTMENLEKRRQQ